MNLARELLAETKTQLVSEWQSRTRYGKVWYPVWIVTATLELLSFLFFMGFIIIAGMLLKGLEEGNGGSVETPAIYKEGERE